MTNNRSNPAKCAFQVAIEHTGDVKDGFKKGKQALRATDRDKVTVVDTKKLQGSLDIDNQVKKIYPRDPRWDYAISYNSKIYYLEVHPAETSEVERVIDKLKWLKWWLKNKAVEIDNLPKAEHPYIWVQSGRFAILSTSKQMRKLSINGIKVTNKLILK